MTKLLQKVKVESNIGTKRSNGKDIISDKVENHYIE